MDNEHIFSKHIDYAIAAILIISLIMFIQFSKVGDVLRNNQITSSATINLDKCGSGEKICSSENSYKVCGNFDTDKDLEFSKPIKCPEGQYCSNGICRT